MNLNFVGHPAPDFQPNDQLEVKEQVLIGDIVAFERTGPGVVRLRKLGPFEQGIYSGTKYVLEQSQKPGSLDIRALG